MYTSPEISLRPFLKWPGGKRWLTTNHLELLPLSFQHYFEPFLGGAAIFFYLRPKRAYLSDINGELINVYRTLKWRWRLVQGVLEVHRRKHCKDYYYAIRQSSPTTSVERAARTIYLNRTCWNGLYRVNRRGQFNVPIGTKSDVLFPSDDFEDIAGALRHAEISAQDFQLTISRAQEDDFVFADPPYTVMHNENGFLKYNESIFCWDDQIRLRNTVREASIRGAKILVTNANHSSIRDLYAGVGKIREIRRHSVLAGDSAHRVPVTELAIKINY